MAVAPCSRQVVVRITCKRLGTASHLKHAQARVGGLLTSRALAARHTGVEHVRRLHTESEISMDEIFELGTTPPTPLTLQQMKAFADGSDRMRLVQSAFLHNELQIRFARAIIELSELPFGLDEMASIQKAKGVYRRSLQAIRENGMPTSTNEDVAFTETLRLAKLNGANLVPLICRGLQELLAEGRAELDSESVQEDINRHLDTFFLARIGIRMLVGQHVESVKRVGGRVQMLNVDEIVAEACERATKLCRMYVGDAPEVKVRWAANTAGTFTYVASHLHHMVFEAVKNAMRATVEYHLTSQQKQSGPINKHKQIMDPNSKLLGFVLPDVEDVQGVTIYPDIRRYRRSGELPPVQIVISQGREDLTIKISDDGGGVPRSNWRKLWHYGYTTSPPYPHGVCAFREHFSGRGYGLPIARLFARYFGGEVTYTSLEGSGSSVFVQANRLGQKTELVPGHASFALSPIFQ